MESENNKFFEVLSEKIALYEDFLDSLAGEKNAIMENSLEDILEKAREKETLVGKLEVNEKKRKEIIAYYSAKFNVPQEELTLLRLSKFFSEPTSGKLLNLRNRLKKQLDSVSKSSKRNEKLIEACSSSLKKTRNFIEQVSCRQSEYSANGKSRNRGLYQGRMLNSRI